MSKSDAPSSPLPQEVVDYYESQAEAQRLFTGIGRLELARTQELLRRYLPPAPAVICDVGGGSGVYACWLASKGYEVHLVDAVPLHVEQARRASENQPDHPLASSTVGDARGLGHPNASVDALLLFGPLYHLTRREDRVAALQEAHRVLRAGGLVLAAGITRFASVLDGLRQGLLDDPEFLRIVQRDVRDGQHRNPANRAGYFTTAYFHRPDELRDEAEAAGLRHVATLAIEGPGWLLQDFDDHWREEARRIRLLNAIRWVEDEPSLMGVSAHVLVVALKEREAGAPVC